MTSSRYSTKILLENRESTSYDEVFNEDLLENRESIQIIRKHSSNNFNEPRSKIKQRSLLDFEQSSTTLPSDPRSTKTAREATRARSKKRMQNNGSIDTTSVLHRHPRLPPKQTPFSRVRQLLKRTWYQTLPVARYAVIRSVDRNKGPSSRKSS